ncbi:MAG: thymidylate synthase [Defluviitaleaceae bacterium]|nr:thymidylate synthase [Defluviitaleaceae bacterium]
MREIFETAKTLPEAYHKAILALYSEGELHSCSDWNQSQRELSATYVADEPFAEPMVSRLYIGGFRELQQYVMEVLDGILDFKIGDGNCWEYTYHDRLVNFAGFDQLNFVVEELKRNADSRRAVAMIRDNAVDPFNADPACLQHLQYFIRGGKLHCKAMMRSNDAVEASFMNAFAFVMLQKRIADRLGVEVGSYAHRANSFHCYEKDFGLLEQYANGIKTKKIEDITYEYEGYYKDLMQESVPEIEKMAASLRAEMQGRGEKNARG